MGGGKKKERLRVLSAKPDTNPFLMTTQTDLLQQRNETTNNSQTQYGSVQADASGRVLAVATAATRSAGGGGVAAGVRVGVLVVALAVVDALDLAASALLGRSELQEPVARRVDVGGADNVEGALDIVQRG